MDQIRTILKTYQETESIKGTVRRKQVSKNTFREYVRRVHQYSKALLQVLERTDSGLWQIVHGGVKGEQENREEVLCPEYFGLTMPHISEYPCHFLRFPNFTKYFYSFLKIPFLNDSPVRSILCEELMSLSKIASSEGMTPSNIANATTSVLSPVDFDNPYFRAIALLIIAYSSKSNTGLVRQLEPNINEDYSARELITVATTDKNQIILNGKPVGQEELFSRLIDFIEANASDHLIKLQTNSSMSNDYCHVLKFLQKKLACRD